MTTLDDYDLFPPTAANDGAPAPRKCRRHEWVGLGAIGATAPESWSCARCGKARDDAVVRRGRTNRSRGNAIEREIGHKLGLRRVGQFGGPDDLTGDLFAVQVKSGASFSERYWSWLRAVPHSAGQTPLLVVTDAPGSAHKRRAIVVLELSEWIALHGPTGGNE